MIKDKTEEDRLNLFDKIFFATVFTVIFFCAGHVDLWETANHSYVFLESIFSGNFLRFYEFCAEHSNTYYYINNANYNICLYAVFGLWELPVFLFNKLFGLALNEKFMIFWAKAVSVGFFLGCGYMVKKISLSLGIEKEKAHMALLFFLFNPIAFFSADVMGQYDSICLFFALLAILFYIKGDMKKFSFIMGTSFVFKFFSLLIFFPLLLLKEKKFLKILKHTAISLWLYIPTTLLFLGKTGNAAAFTRQMTDRVTSLTIDTGMGAVSVYVLLYACIIFICYIYEFENSKDINYIAVYTPMAVFALLFLTIYWHPQWLILVVPFLVITSFSQANKTPWFLLDIVLSGGFMFLNFYKYPMQMGANLLNSGILPPQNFISNVTISHFLNLIPYMYTVTLVMFTGGLLLNIILKLPLKSVSLADRISPKEFYNRLSLKNMLYIQVAIGFFAFWLIPSILEYINRLGII
jgi:hypothetical protein